MPLALRIAVISGIALLVVGAAVLMLSRGSAMMLDLSAAAARLFCL